MQKLRFLDVDDLLLLTHLNSGRTLASASRALGISQSAVTQRLRKIESVFIPNIVQRTGRNAELTVEGRNLCQRIAGIMGSMEELAEDYSEVGRFAGS